MKFWDFIRSLFCCCDCDDDNDVQWNEDQTDNRKNSLRKNRKQNSKTKAPIQRVQTTLCLNFSFVYGCKVRYCSVVFFHQTLIWSFVMDFQIRPQLSRTIPKRACCILCYAIGINGYWWHQE